MCVEAKPNHDSLVSPVHNSIEQLWDELLRCILDLSIKNGLGFPRMVCDVTCFRFDLVMVNLLLQEKITPFLTNLMQVN